MNSDSRTSPKSEGPNTQKVVGPSGSGGLPCKRCQGRGLVIVKYAGQPDGIGSCPDCGGSGKRGLATK
jgi:hypothetical protein